MIRINHWKCAHLKCLIQELVIVLPFMFLPIFVLVINGNHQVVILFMEKLNVPLQQYYFLGLG